MTKPIVNVNVGGPTKPSCTYKTKVLKGNLPFAAQVSDEATKYVIKFDFDIGGGSVTIPEGCLLEFDGGSISNGTVVGQETILIYHQAFADILHDVTTEGTFVWDKITTDDESIIEDDGVLQVNTNGILAKHIKAGEVTGAKLNADVVDDSTLEISANKIKAKAAGIQGSHLNSNVADGSSLELSGNALQIKANGVQGSMLNENVVDDEDIHLTSENKLQLKDRDTTDGMGMVILRKGESFASQLMQTNTVYVIRYDFTLTGNVTVPAGCVLQFEGGSISGTYTITGQNTGIDAGLVKIFNTNVTLAGSWDIVEAYPEWFGAIGNYSHDDTVSIQKCLDSFNFCYLSGIYLITDSVIVRTSCKLYGKNKTCFLITRSDIPLIGVTGRYAEIRGINIRNDLTLANQTSNSAGIQLNEGLSNSQFTNINITSCFYGIKGLNNVWQNYFECFRIDKCYCGIYFSASSAAIFNMFVHTYIGECTSRSIYISGYKNILFENLNIDGTTNTANVMRFEAASVQIKQANIEGFTLQYPVYNYNSTVYLDSLLFTLGTLTGNDTALIMCEKGECHLNNVRKASAVTIIQNDVIAISGATVKCIDTNFIIQGNATKVQTTISGSTRPTLTNKNQDIGITFFDTNLNKTITWNGSAWVDENGFTATATRGTTRPTGSVAGGVLDATRDVGFVFFDTSSGMNKPIYVKSILGNGVVNWVDATGAAV